MTRQRVGISLQGMGTYRERAVRYRLVLRGELGDQFGYLFEGMHLERDCGTTVLSGTVADQSHLAGILERTQELGLELISVARVDQQRRGP